MKKLFLCLALFSALGATAQTQFTVTVTNPQKQARTDQPVIIDLSRFGEVHSARVTMPSNGGGQGVELPCQLDDLDQDGQFDELCFLVDLASQQRQRFTVTLNERDEPFWYAPRVYAEMVMRNDKVKEKNRHNNYIESITARGDCANSYNLQHHHGVCFESELNGIRIYFDKRQTLDLYGKFHKRLELKDTQFYTTAEQKKQGYGDDVLWVGNTFGLGAFRGWNGVEPTMVEPVRSRTQRIISYGPLRTIVEVQDRGWKADEAKPAIDMTLRYTQYAGHRDTDVDVTFAQDVSDYLFSTGIINVKESEEFSDEHGLRACWGTAFPATDTLKWKRETVGLAVLVPERNILNEEAATPDNYAYVLRIPAGQMSYKVCYCSANEEFGFHSAAEWFAWLQEWKRELQRPLDVKY